MKNIKYLYRETWGSFNNHSGSILLLSSPFTNIDLHVNILCMIFVHVWEEVLEDHLLNPRYQNVSELRPHHNGDICTRKMTSSSYMGYDVNLFGIFGYLGGPDNACGRTAIIGLGLSLHASDISCVLIYMSNMGSNLIRTLLIKILNMKNMVFCCIFGAMRGVLTLNPGVPRCPQMQTSYHIGDICTSR